VVGAILVMLLGAFFLSATAAQMTSEENGQRILRRSVAELTDIDGSLTKIEADLHAAAATTEETTVRVPGYPIPIDLPREDALTLSGPALRDRLLDNSANLIYDDGMSVWADGDPEATRNIDRVSPAGAVNRGLGLIRDSYHTVFLVITVLIGLVVLGMLVIAVVFLPRDARLVVLGAVTLVAALPALAVAVGLRFAFRTADADGDAFVDGLLDVGADAMWIPIRNFLTLSLLGSGLLVTGLLFVWWEGKAMDQRTAETGV
jgi:hypothetical protein